MSSPSQRIRAAWRSLAPLPGGRRVFAWILRRLVPYSGSIRPRVIAMEPGRAVVAIRDTRRVRNHLRSVHAIALANLGELASGLAMTLALPPGIRGIPVRLEIDYLKKARGRITAEGRADPPSEVPEDTHAMATAELTDGDGAVVARVVAHWRIGPVEPGP